MTACQPRPPWTRSHPLPDNPSQTLHVWYIHINICIYAYIDPQNHSHVCKYAMHGVCGHGKSQCKLRSFSSTVNSVGGSPRWSKVVPDEGSSIFTSLVGDTSASAEASEGTPSSSLMVILLPMVVEWAKKYSLAFVPASQAAISSAKLNESRVIGHETRTSRQGRCFH